MSGNPSPIGVISFPHLFTPRAPQPGADERYSLILIFDQNAQNTPEFKKMKSDVYACAKAKFGDKTDEMIKNGQLRMPFRDANEKSKYPGFDDGCVFISAWSKQKPDVIDGRLNPVLESDLYPGCLGRITYNPFAYDNSGNRGCSIGLNNTQIADFTTPRLDGKRKGQDDFDSIDEQSADADAMEDVPF